MDLIQFAKRSEEEATPKLRDLLTKKPFTRVMPEGHYDHGVRYGDPTEESLASE